MDKTVPQELISEQLSLWRDQEKRCKQQLKLWQETGDCVGRGDLNKARKLLDQLEESAALTSLREWCQHEERQRPLRFARQLREAAEAASLSCQQLGDSPPTLRLDPLEVELDFGRGEAVLRYARLEVARTALDPARILSERVRVLASLEGDGFQPEDFLARLYEAYRRSLTLARLRWGERVDLVDVLPEVAFLGQSEKFRKDPSREQFRPYGKVRFAYDLARLRRSRQLEHQGARLTLGTATLGTTRQKDRVLFLEEAGQGQYYLSLAFQGANP